MAPALSAQQKAITAQFRDLTGANDKSAARYLKNANYRLGEAVDTFYGGSNAGSGAGTPSPADAELNKIFDSLRGENDPADTLGPESTMVYFDKKLGVNLENAEGFLAMYIVQAPTLGQISRKGFVEGWKAVNAPLTISDQARYIKNQIAHLADDPALFKNVYRHTFLAAKEPDLKAINLTDALLYWEVLFAAPGWQWRSRNRDWLSLWKEFLAAKWTRSVNKDMWNQTLEFAMQSVRDESLAFWNEDGAWPSVIDSFVVWLKANTDMDPAGAMNTDT